jgi:hypothetical protein
MAFINKQDGSVLSFATYEDVYSMDRRVFEANEIATDDLTKEEVVEDMLIRSTTRLIKKVQASAWWQRYTANVSSVALGAGGSIPLPDATKFERKDDWTELCVYHTLAEYLYPHIADFGDEASPEVAKITFYRDKLQSLWDEMLAVGDWYDDDNDGTVEDNEKLLNPRPTRRSRGYRKIAEVR